MEEPSQPFDRFRALRTEPRQYFRAWKRGRRARPEFDAVRAYCLFVGTPRSGHSLVGAMLNAHPRAVIAHGLDITRHFADGYRRDQLYSMILRGDRKFTRGKSSVGSGFDYAIPGQWQGRYEAIEVIGHKRGGAASRAFAADPTLFDRFARCVGVPLRFIHVVRHPYDNIATISRRHEMPLADATEWFFGMCESTEHLMRRLDSEQSIRVHHEDFVAEPDRHLRSLCTFLGLEPEPAYVEACAGLVWGKPRRTRGDVAWPDDLREKIAKRAAQLPFLTRYDYDA